jgi:hypothetical protein
MQMVFVSKPNTLNPQQYGFWQSFKAILIRHKLQPRTVGETDESDSAVLDAVRQLLLRCDGAIILGLRQAVIRDLIFSEGTEKEVILTAGYLPTPWNHIEAGMAMALRIPLFVLHEEGIVGGGVFEDVDSSVLQVDLSRNCLTSQVFRLTFKRWLTRVAEFRRSSLVRETKEMCQSYQLVRDTRASLCSAAAHAASSTSSHVKK